MNLLVILIILALLLGGNGLYGHSSYGWSAGASYGPVGLIVVVLVICLLFGVL